MHISCIIDAPNSIIKGTLFIDSSSDNMYFNNLTSSFSLPQSDYSLYLNVDPR